MYLSSAFMRNKTYGQKQAYYLISYLSAYLTEGNLEYTMGALRKSLLNIDAYLGLDPKLIKWDNLFLVENNQLFMKDTFKELCLKLKDC